MFVYWSFATPADEYQKRGAGDRLGFLAHTIVHFFDKHAGRARSGSWSETATKGCMK